MSQWRLVRYPGGCPDGFVSGGFKTKTINYHKLSVETCWSEWLLIWNDRYASIRPGLKMIDNWVIKNNRQHSFHSCKGILNILRLVRNSCRFVARRRKAKQRKLSGVQVQIIVSCCDYSEGRRAFDIWREGKVGFWEIVREGDCLVEVQEGLRVRLFSQSFFSIISNIIIFYFVL